MMKFIRLPAQYGGSVLLQQIVYKWIEILQYGQTSVTDAQPSQCAVTSMTERNTEHVHIIFKNRRETTDETANHLQITHGSIKSSVTEVVHMQFHAKPKKNVSLKTYKSLCWTKYSRRSFIQNVQDLTSYG
jgi:hypothetical protein